MTLADFEYGLAKFQFWHNGCFVGESIKKKKEEL
jgi:hypothetical protein